MEREQILSSLWDLIEGKTLVCISQGNDHLSEHLQIPNVSPTNLLVYASNAIDSRFKTYFAA
jgi:hypothetical protein